MGIRFDPKAFRPGRASFIGAMSVLLPSSLMHLSGKRLSSMEQSLERDLYIEERKAERGVYWRQRREELKKAPILEKPPIFMRLVVHCTWIIVMFG